MVVMQVVLSKEMLLKVFSCGTKICMVSTNSLYMFSSRSLFLIFALFICLLASLSLRGVIQLVHSALLFPEIISVIHGFQLI